MKDDLSLIYEQLRQSAVQIETLTRTRERKRIARDLHDSLGHALTSLNIQLQAAAKLWKLDPTQAEQFLTQAQNLGSMAIAEVRQSVRLLRSIESLDQPLEALIQVLVAEVGGADLLISTELQLTVSLPEAVTITLYRIVQEALTNIRKHAAATEVNIQLQTIANTVQLTIRDNGRGFCLQKASAGFGLQGMAERVAILKGTLNIKTAPMAGCQISVQLPIETVEMAGNELIAVGEVRALTEPCLQWTLTPEQQMRVEQLLMNYIGPIAPLLLEQTIKQVEDKNALLQSLADRIPIAQRSEFVQIMTQRLAPATEAKLDVPIETDCLDANWMRQCEDTLAGVVGPIAPLLVQQTLRSLPQFSQMELIEALANQIPDAQAAIAFQQQMMPNSKSSFGAESFPSQSEGLIAFD